MEQARTSGALTLDESKSPYVIPSTTRSRGRRENTFKWYILRLRIEESMTTDCSKKWSNCSISMQSNCVEVENVVDTC